MKITSSKTIIRKLANVDYGNKCGRKPLSEEGSKYITIKIPIEMIEKIDTHIGGKKRSEKIRTIIMRYFDLTGTI